MKGSKHAILKLVESDRFLDSMNGMIKSTGAEIKVYDNWMPKSLQLDKEAELKIFLKYNFTQQLSSEVVEWWLHKDAKTPNWDLISTCTIDGERGLLLVEAKAHFEELDTSAKRPPSPTSDDSKLNHDKIDKAIEQAKKAINEQVDGVSISRDNCYQLSNRGAHAWWLADKGIPVVLLYLGFLNCKDMDYGSNKLFKKDEDWQKSFKEHAELVGVDKILEKKVELGSGKSHFTTICRSYELEK